MFCAQNTFKNEQMNRITQDEKIALFGLCLMGAGLYLISLPLALIVIGTVFFILGILSAVMAGRRS